MPIRLSVWNLMVAVAVIGVALGAFRVNFSLGSFASGTMAMALVRTSERLDRLRSRGQPIRQGDRLWIFAKSLGLASILLAASLIPAVCCLGVLISPNLHWARPSGLAEVFAIAVCALVGWPVSSAMRRLMW